MHGRYETEYGAYQHILTCEATSGNQVTSVQFKDAEILCRNMTNCYTDRVRITK
jgi:hypothetical protein